MNTAFRNYKANSINNVEQTYKSMLENQTLDYVANMKTSLSMSKPAIYGIWDIIDKLESIVDDSDPDTELPQIFHAYQTANIIKEKYVSNSDAFNRNPIKVLFSQSEWASIPTKYKQMYNTTINNLYKHIKEWDWFILVGFIHDLGKILLLIDFGQLPQWAVVGDTFPLGHKLDTNYVFYNKNYHKNNADLSINTYINHCGFNNVVFSWGHDEYLAKMLENNNIKLPKEAMYIIRYHSFYSWHTPSNNIRGYTDLASDYDWHMLPLLKCFQQADLYSKTDDIPCINMIKQTFSKLIDKYIPRGKLGLQSSYF